MRKGFRFYEGNAIDWDRNSRSLARRMIEEFAGQIRGVGRRVKPRPDKRFIPPVDSISGDPFGVFANHVHFVPAHPLIRIGAYGGLCFFLYCIAILWTRL